MRDFFERYADRIARGAPDACWHWTGAKASAGYGHGNRNGEHFYAHRAAFESRHGAGAAAGQVVRHRCDNPPCCNPAHLLVGTHADNSADKWERGRGRPVRGEMVNTAKVTEADVIEMRRLAAAGVPIARIADQFPLGHTTITLAVKGETWSHLPGAVTEVTKAPVRKKRPGEGATLLNPDKVRAIKDGLKRGERGTRLAERFGVSPVTISAIKVGRIWGHVS